MALDRNAATKARLRRNAEQDGAGQGTALVVVGKPLFNSGTKITLTLDPLAGLVTNVNGLGVKLSTLNSALTFDGAGGLHVTTADASMSLSSGGLSVNVGAAGGLSVPSLPAGLGIKLDGTSLSTSVSGALVNLAANSGLQIVSGLLLKLADTSLALSSSGVAANLATNSGLQVSSGLLLKLADTSLQLAAGGASVKPAANGGLSVSSGLLVSGFRLVSADPGSPSQGDTWFNTTSQLPKVASTTSFTTNLTQTFFAGAGSTIVNTAALTAFTPNVAVPAGFLNLLGRTTRIKAYLNASITGTPTFTLSLQFNGSVVWSTTMPGASVNDAMLDLICTVIVIGGSGVIFAQGFMTSVGGVLSAVNFANTINLTNSGTFGLYGQWSAASPSNSVTAQYIISELLS